LGHSKQHEEKLKTKLKKKRDTRKRDRGIIFLRKRGLADEKSGGHDFENPRHAKKGKILSDLDPKWKTHPEKGRNGQTQKLLAAHSPTFAVEEYET